MAETVKAIVKNKRDTAANLTSDNLTFNNGEIVFESDTLKFKVGDGVTSYNSLDYFKQADVPIMQRFDTGWISITDWTNILVTVNHNLDASIDQLDIRFFIDTDNGAGTGVIQMGNTAYNDTSSTLNMGFQIQTNDADNIDIQTGASGLTFLDSSGLLQILDTEAWAYKVVVTKFTI